MTGAAVTLRPISELVVEGANLNPDEWQPARISALLELLPSEFRDPGSAISMLARAQRSGLDPFIREIHAWKDQRGNLCFHTARDGWVRIAENDEDIDSLSFGVVYKGDSFSWKQDGRKIVVEHTGGIAAEKEIVGAYCVVHRVHAQADHIERRVMADYRHLLSKDNWKNYPEDMILTRVISAAVKFCSPLGAGIYTPDEAAEVGLIGTSGNAVLVDMDAKADALAGRLGAVQEAEYEITDGGGTPGTPPESEPKPFDHQCEMCGEFYGSKRSLAGHYKAHRDERAARDTLPEGWNITPERFGETWVYVAVDPDGELMESQDTYLEACTWIVQFVAEEAQHSLENDDAQPEKELAEAVGEPIPVESPAEGVAKQQRTTATRRELPWTASRISSLVSSHSEIGPKDIANITGGKNILELDEEERRLVGISLLGMIDERREVASAP